CCSGCESPRFEFPWSKPSFMKPTPPPQITLLLAALAAAPTFAQSSQVTSPAEVQERARSIRRAHSRLNSAWSRFAEKNARGAFKPPHWAKFVQPMVLTADVVDAKLAGAADFAQPTDVRSSDGNLTVTLTVEKALNHIGEDPVLLRNYNGKLTGPTLRCLPGDTLYITVDNKLAPGPFLPGAMNTLHGFDTTNLHTHGLHVSPTGNSDNILLQVEPQSRQQYEIAIPTDHPCGTFWYHAHLHGSTAANVGSGMSGALIIEGGIDDIPEIAAAVERVLVLQQIPYVNNDSKAACNADQDTPVIPPDKDLSIGVIEPEYADCSFGPGTWDELGRYTTINGIKTPIIRMRPGSVERWRLVDSAVREVIEPELVRLTGSPAGSPASLQMHEIAVDGLPLGRLAARDKLELWPGYRSDVLVRAPNVPGVRYLLRDDREVHSPIAEERRHLAIVEVVGDPRPMELPSDASLAAFRLPSIDPVDVTGRELASYGIFPKGGSVTFSVDRTPFSEEEARQITLGEVHEWTLTSRNGVGPVSHPFHIHVNPFEIFSMVDEHDEEQLDRDPITGAVLPVWRDTIILKEGWKVSARTRYTDFTGVFVQHCHILDHEDQGMMELIQINPPEETNGDSTAHFMRPQRPYQAPAFSLPDARGKTHTLADYRGRPTMVVFFEGLGCVRCNEQLQAITTEFQSFADLGVQVVAVGLDPVEAIRGPLEARPYPFPVLADPELRAFRDYGCYSAHPLHGLFLLDAQGLIRWQSVSWTPFMDLALLRSELALISSPQSLTVDAVR
ncbi:MAG: redoxin domain-containing protein, partial [Planctomycetota bacterium]